MTNLKEVILRLPEFRNSFDPHEPLTIEKCASYLGHKFIMNSIINTQINEGIDSLRIIMKDEDR